MLPITLAPAHADVAPHTYVLHRRSQHCSNCGTLHEYSQCYAKTHLRSRTGAGKYVTNLRPLDSPQFNLPIEVMTAPAERVPFCCECFTAISLAHLPLPPQNDTQRITGGPQHATEPSTKRPKTAQEILDLI